MYAIGKSGRFVRLCFCCLITLVTQSVVRAGDVITWATQNWPPVYIVPGPGAPTNLARQGWGDLVVEAISRALPEYEHKRLLVNAERMVAMNAAGEHLCSATVILTPERNKVRYFTYATFAEPLHLVTTVQTKSRLRRRNDAVSLTELTRDAGFKGLIASKRSYGLTLDPILRGQDGVSHVPETNSPDMGTNLLPMLLAGRMDYTIEFPSHLSYLAAVDKRYAALVATPIKEDQKLVWGGVACPRTPWGKQVIEKIDRIMPQLVKTITYREALERWLDPAQRQALRKQIDEFYAFRSVQGKTNF